jgi:hypothetical protein
LKFPIYGRVNFPQVGRQEREFGMQRYMVAEIVRLIEAAERVLETERRTTVPLTIIRRKAA